MLLLARQPKIKSLEITQRASAREHNTHNNNNNKNNTGPQTLKPNTYQNNQQYLVGICLLFPCPKGWMTSSSFWILLEGFFCVVFFH
jgi:hypothetical protein